MMLNAFQGDLTDTYAKFCSLIEGRKPVRPYKPKYRISHPENYLVHYLKRHFLDQSIQKNVKFLFGESFTSDSRGNQ